MKSWIRRLLLLGIVLALAGGTVLYLAANVFFQPEKLVHKLEERLNCRASMSAVELALFEQPARLVIKNFAMAERDRHADEQTPLADRPPMADPQITAKEISLAVSFPHLLLGKIHVHEFLGSEVTGKLIKPEEGDHSLDRLFDKPGRDDKKSKKDRDKEKDDKGGDETIDRLKISTSLRSARLEDFTFVMELEKRDTRISWTDVHLDLSNVELSPADLETKNHAKIAIRANVLFDHLESGERFGNMVLQGSGDVRPVDPKTRKIEPAVSFQLEALAGTRLETAPLMRAVAEKLRDLEKYGIQLEDIRLGGDLVQPARLKGNYQDHQFTLTEDTTVDFADYGFSLAEGSWYESENGQHEFKTTLMAGPAITEGVLGGVDRYISRKVRFLPSDVFRRLVGDHFLKDGRFTLKLITKGDIGKPRVGFSEKLPDIDVEAVKDSAEDLLKDLKSIFR